MVMSMRISVHPPISDMQFAKCLGEGSEGCRTLIAHDTLSGAGHPVATPNELGLDACHEGQVKVLYTTLG
jgi:hypothetical protein